MINEFLKKEKGNLEVKKEKTRQDRFVNRKKIHVGTQVEMKISF